MKQLIELFNKKYGATYGVIDDSIDNEDVYKVYKMIKSLCSDDQEIMEMLNKIKLPNPRTASESIEKINAEHVSEGGVDDLIKYVDDKTEILPVANKYVIFEDAVPRLMEDTVTYGSGDSGINSAYIFDNLQNTDIIVHSAKFNLIISFNDGTEDITENIIVDVSEQTSFGKYIGDYFVTLQYNEDTNLIVVSVTKEIETDNGYEEIPCTVTKATFICILYSNLLNNNVIKNIKYEQITQVPDILDGLANKRYEALENKEYYYLYDNSFVWDMNKINERLDENSGVTQNTSINTIARRVIKVNQKDSEGIGFGQLVPINNKRDVSIFARADVDVIVKVYNPNTKELMLTMNFDTNNSFEFTKGYIPNYQLNGINNIFIAFTTKDTPSSYEYQNKVHNLIVTDEHTFLKKAEILTKANTKEYIPTGDYNPATKKYVDEKFLSNSATHTMTLKLNTNELNFIQSRVTNSYNDMLELITKEDLSSIIDNSIETIIFEGLERYPYKVVGAYRGFNLKEHVLLELAIDDSEDDYYTVHRLKITYSDDYGKCFLSSYYGDLTEINALPLNNTTEYTPTEDYNPATKKYVDEKTASIDTTINNNLPSNGALTLTTNKFQTTTLATPTEIQLPEVTGYAEIHLFFTGVSGVTIGTGTTNVKWENQPTIEDNKTYELIFTYINDTIGWVAKTVVYS